MYGVPQASITQRTASIYNVADSSFTFYTLPYSLTPKTFNSTISKKTSFTGFTPKNNKCFVYPYNYLYVSNNQGSYNIFKYEEFSTSSCVFENQFVITIGGSR